MFQKALAHSQIRLFFFQNFFIFLALFTFKKLFYFSRSTEFSNLCALAVVVCIHIEKHTHAYICSYIQGLSYQA